MIFKTTYKFYDVTNPYEKNTKNWHIWLDIWSVVPRVTSPCFVNIDTMIQVNDTDLNYYKNHIEQLVRDGYLEHVDSKLQEA